MLKRRDALIGALAMTIGLSTARAETQSDDTILPILRERVDDRRSVGLIAGVIDSTGRRLSSYGHADTAEERPLDGDTVFEIGSITKVFTALLLADMIVRGEVAADDPVAKYLPVEVNVPTYHDRQITLVDLATYASGLPRNPSNLTPRDHANPFADYTVEQLYAFLASSNLQVDPGTRFEYGNAAFGLLGHALALAANRDFEELLVSRVCEPLGLADTRITLTSSMRERLATGHDAMMKPTNNWDMPTLAGTGSLRSTANDLFRFLEATCLQRSGPSIRPATKMLLSMRRPTDKHSVEAAWGWFVLSKYDDEIVWKTGGTGGYSSFVGFSPQSRRGSVVLSNAGIQSGIDAIGFHLINSRYPPSRQRAR